MEESTLYSVTFECFPSSWTMPSYSGGFDGTARERRLPIVYANQSSAASKSTPTTTPTPTPALAPTLSPLEGDPVMLAGPVNSGMFFVNEPLVNMATGGVGNMVSDTVKTARVGPCE